MEKNENGYPMNQSRNLSQNGNTQIGGVTEHSTGQNSGRTNTQNGTQNGVQNQGIGGYRNDQYGNQYGNRGATDNGYQGDERYGTQRGGEGCSRLGRSDSNGMAMSGCGGNTALDSLMPAYVYAPTQKFAMLYRAKDALAHGTLFEELYKPMEVYGRE